MEYYNNILCVSGSEIIRSEINQGGLISKDLWDKWVKKGVKVVRRACYGQPSLIDFNTIPVKYRNMIAEKMGVPSEEATIKPFKERITTDANAVTFYTNFLLSDGSHLEPKHIKEYTANASVLNAIKEVFENQKIARAAAGGSMRNFWQTAIIAVNNVRVEFGHNLPSAAIPLKRRYELYLEKGYSALVSRKFGNDNSRKVSADIERLLLSLYSMPNKPFATDVHSLYSKFLNGEIQVACHKTAELFTPEQFIHNGKPLEISETTVSNYLNQPKNRIIVEKVRSGAHRFNSTRRPHHHRHAPEFSFSKITMDDRDLPRKCINGKWVKSYYAYDVASGCVVGYAYSLNKDEQLFIDCLRDLFRLIEREGFGMPLEVEVEHHLVNKFFEDLSLMFSFLRICNPGNSQEKHAEHFNRQKKYGVEKQMQNGIGRWWSKHEAYTVDRDKVNDEFVEKMFTYERLVADDIEAVKAYNNQLHPKQKKYPGKTRWQVLVENMNPNAAQPPKALIYKSIGERVQTTIRRSQYVQVQYEKYQLSSVNILERLLPNNYTVEAYYLPSIDGVISEVFLFQGSTFLCKADKIATYNTSKAEWSNEDKDGFLHQSSYVSEFDSLAKKGKQDLHSPVIIKSDVIREALQAPVEVVKHEPIEQSSVDEMLNNYNPDDYAQQAIDDL